MESIDNMKFEKVYSIEELLNLGFNPTIARDIYTFDIPTPIVITEPGMYTPMQGRIFTTEYYWYNNQVCNYAQLMHLTTKIDGTFKGTSNYPNIYIKEVYQDWGDDGHIEYTFKGYILTIDHSFNTLNFSGK